MTAFLKTLFNERLKDIEDTAERVMDNIYTLRSSLFRG